MRRESADEVAEAARRRLAALGRELAGDGPGAAVQGGVDDVRLPAAAEPASVAPPGRHSRRRPVPWGRRGAAWLADRLPTTLQGRVSLGLGHVAVVAVVVAVALAVAAYLSIRSRPTVTAVPTARTSAATASPVSLAAPAPSETAAETAAATVVVDVAGKVRHPGVTTLPAGSRVVDAIRRAGGARPGVDLSSLNLARVLVDGEQVLVGVVAAPGVAASAASRPGSSGAGPLLNLNTATLEQLDGLPGVGPVTARKILDWRSAHGAFTAIDELLEIDGIGEKTLADMAPLLTL